MDTSEFRGKSWSRLPKCFICKSRDRLYNMISNDKRMVLHICAYCTVRFKLWKNVKKHNCVTYPSTIIGLFL